MVTTTDNFETLSSVSLENDTLLPTQDTDTSLPHCEDKTFKNIYTTLRCIQGIITIFVNVITIIAITKYRKLMTTSNLLILSLSVADTVTGINPFFNAVEEILERYSSTIVWYHICQITTFVSLVSFTGNYVTIVFIACDRFVCVRYPLFHRQTASLRRMKLYILTVWFFIVLTILFEVIFLEDDAFRMNPCKACTWTQYFSDKGHFISMKLPLFTCTVITTILYIIVGYLAKTRLKKVKPNVTIMTMNRMSSISTFTFKDEGQQRKVTKMMALVIGTYYGLYLPSALQSYLNYNPVTKSYVYYTCSFIFFMNALVNPFIYSWQSSEFAAAYKQLMTRRKQDPLSQGPTVTKTGLPSDRNR